jgi:hypothetical protein
MRELQQLLAQRCNGGGQLLAVAPAAAGDIRGTQQLAQLLLQEVQALLQVRSAMVETLHFCTDGHAAYVTRRLSLAYSLSLPPCLPTCPPPPQVESEAVAASDVLGAAKGLLVDQPEGLLQRLVLQVMQLLGVEQLDGLPATANRVSGVGGSLVFCRGEAPYGGLSVAAF